MKTIKEFYNEVAGSAELQKEFTDALSKGKDAVIAFARAHGCEATEEEALAFFQSKSDSTELSDTDLDAVAGGKPGGAVLVSVFTLGFGCAVLSVTGAATQMGCKEALELISK